MHGPYFIRSPTLTVFPVDVGSDGCTPELHFGYEAANLRLFNAEVIAPWISAKTLPCCVEAISCYTNTGAKRREEQPKEIRLMYRSTGITTLRVAVRAYKYVLHV